MRNILIDGDELYTQNRFKIVFIRRKEKTTSQTFHLYISCFTYIPILNFYLFSFSPHTYLPFHLYSTYKLFVTIK